MRFEISIEGNGRSFPCRDDQSVLSAMTLANSRGVQVGCRSGGCGVCCVRVDEGQYELGQMSRQQVSLDHVRQGYVMACQLYPRSDLKVTAVGRLTAAVAGRDLPRAKPAANDSKMSMGWV